MELSEEAYCNLFSDECLLSTVTELTKSITNRGDCQGSEMFFEDRDDYLLGNNKKTGKIVERTTVCHHHHHQGMDRWWASNQCYKMQCERDTLTIIRISCRDGEINKGTYNIVKIRHDSFRIRGKNVVVKIATKCLHSWTIQNCDQNYHIFV